MVEREGYCIAMMNGLPKRTPNADITQLPGSLPVADIAQDVDHEAIATSQISNLATLCAEHFAENALWRDSFALTGTLRTFFSASTIETAWRQTSSCFRRPANFALKPKTSRIARFGPKTSWVEASFTFETEARLATTCSGFISIVPDSKGGWKIWLLRTILEQLRGYGNVDELEPRRGLADGIVNGKPNGTANGTSSCSSNSVNSTTKFDCVVVGGGQAGLAIGGRLMALGVSYVVLDRNERIGDNWMLRYDSAKLHTTREYAHMPFERTFTPDEPEFLPRHRIVAGLQRWVDKYGINIWLSANLESSSWDEIEGVWTLNLQHHGQSDEIKARHLVFAVGAGCQIPRIPEYPNKEIFEGVAIHSAIYKSAAAWKGKAGVIIGTANTAHDVAEDMLDAGLSSVTMVQRGRTYVIPREYYVKASDSIYNAQVPTDIADRISLSNPTSISRLLSMAGLNGMARQEPERFDALERAGFKVERYGDLFQCLYERFGGHYMDVGTSAKITNGQIKIKSSPITHYTSSGLAFEDGTSLEADVIVFTTGFEGNMREALAPMLGTDVTSRLEDWWGIDEEGELKGAYKPSGHSNLWYHGGTIGQARFWSRFIALQIKADLVGMPLEVHRRP